MQTEAQVLESNVEYPENIGKALETFKVGSSQFLRGLVLAVYSWSLAKVLPDFVALYGGTMGEALSKGLPQLRHGLAVYVAASYYGAPVSAPVDFAGLSMPMKGFVTKAAAIGEKRKRIGVAAVLRNAQNQKDKAARGKSRKAERQARKKARR